MKAHGLLEPDGRRYAYRLTDKRTRAALLFVLFQQRVCGPLVNDFSGIDAYPDLERSLSLNPHAVAVAPHLLLHAQCRIDCSLRMVLVRDRRAASPVDCTM
jgi:hypothetical protein